MQFQGILNSKITNTKSFIMSFQFYTNLYLYLEFKGKII